jgi:hypothetical protein
MGRAAVNFTDEMVEAGARAMYALTKTGQKVQFDLLPAIVQYELKAMALAALQAAETARPKPES